MRRQRCVWVSMLMIMMALFSFQSVRAGECDEVYDRAKKIHTSADDALHQKDYDRAAVLYREAISYYEQASSMEDCSCPKIHGASQGNAGICRNMISKCQDVKTQSRFIEEYNRAGNELNQGNAYAANREWDRAIASFEEAARIWDGLAASSQDENGQRASNSARQAREAANMARQYQQQ